MGPGFVLNHPQPTTRRGAAAGGLEVAQAGVGSILISMLFLCCGGIEVAPPLPTRI